MLKHYLPLASLLLSTAALPQAGTLDGDFSADGLQFTLINAHSSRAQDVAILPNGYLIVAGQANESASVRGIAVAKYVPDGELDMTFGTGGTVYMDLNDIGNDDCNAVQVQSDGKILLAGNMPIVPGGFNQLLLARLLENGTLDPDFGFNGIANLSVPNCSVEAEDLVLRPDGKMVLSGQCTCNGVREALVALFNTDGTLDQEFGAESGYSKLPLGENCFGYAVALDASGNIILGGTTGGTERLVVARFLPDGSLDTSFDADGYRRMDLGGPEEVTAVYAQGDKILVAGTVDGDAFVVRLNSDGSNDNSWGTAGVMRTSHATGSYVVENMALQADGKVVLCGTLNGRSFLLRTTYSGQLDLDFGSSALVEGPSETRGAKGIAIQADNRIVIAGEGFTEGTTRFMVARYHAGNMTSVPDRTTDNEVGLWFFPNPVRAAATVAIELDHASVLNATLHDASGRLVRTLFTAKAFAMGRHETAISLDDLPPGEYMIVFVGGTQRTTLRIVLI